MRFFFHCILSFISINISYYICYSQNTNETDVDSICSLLYKYSIEIIDICEKSPSAVYNHFVKFSDTELNEHIQYIASQIGILKKNQDYISKNKEYYDNRFSSYSHMDSVLSVSKAALTLFAYEAIYTFEHAVERFEIYRYECSTLVDSLNIDDPNSEIYKLQKKLNSFSLPDFCSTPIVEQTVEQRKKSLYIFDLNIHLSRTVRILLKQEHLDTMPSALLFDLKKAIDFIEKIEAN